MAKLSSMKASVSNIQCLEVYKTGHDYFLSLYNYILLKMST